MHDPTAWQTQQHEAADSHTNHDPQATLLEALRDELRQSPDRKAEIEAEIKRVEAERKEKNR